MLIQSDFGVDPRIGLRKRPRVWNGLRPVPDSETSPLPPSQPKPEALMDNQWINRNGLVRMSINMWRYTIVDKAIQLAVSPVSTRIRLSVAARVRVHLPHPLRNAAPE